MAKVRFLSSALDGQTVTLSATQGGITRGPNTIAAWGVTIPGNQWQGAGPATLTVTVQEIVPQGATFAPYPVEWRIRVTGTSYTTPEWNTPSPVLPDHWVDLSGTPQEDTYRLALEEYDPSFQRCHFVVHTGDTGNYRNEWVGSPSHRNKAYQYGQNPGHVYDAPGTYTGRGIYVYDDEGNWGTLALDDLVITNPDDDFDAASTIVVSPTSDWTDAPVHDVANRCTSLHEASLRFEAIKGSVTAGVRICVKAGAVLNERANGFDSAGANGVCLVDTYGGSERCSYSERNQDLDPGANRKQLFFIGDEAWAWRIRDFEFDLGYDVNTGRPTNPEGWLGGNKTLCRSLLAQTFPAAFFDDVTRLGDPSCRVVIHNCDVTGCGWYGMRNLNARNIASRDHAWFVNDVEFYNNADYSIFSPGNLFCLGVKHYDTAVGFRDIGGGGREPTMGTSRGWTGHPILVREKDAWTIYIRATYMENRGAWSGGGFLGHRGSQPIMRLRDANEPVEPAGWMVARAGRQFFCDSVIVGSFNNGAGDDIRADNDPTQTIDLRHTVIENCLVVHDPQSGAEGPLTGVQARGSVRNCVFLCLESPETSISRGALQMPNRDMTRFASDDNRAGLFDFFIQSSGNILKAGDRFENRHNTFIMLRQTSQIVNGSWNMRRASTKHVWDDADFEITEGHNVISAPRLDVPEGLSEAQLEKINLPAGMRILDVWVKFYWETILDYALASPVAVGAETPAIPYPVDWYQQPTTGAQYAGSAGNNAIRFNDGVLSANRYYEPPKDYPNSTNVQASGDAGTITVIHDCDAAGVVQGDGTGTHFKIVNNSSDEWPASSMQIILDRSGFGAMAADVRTNIDQSDFKIYRPATPQALDAGLGSLLFDFNRNLRPNAGFPISPTSGTNAAGALLPA